MNEVKIPPLAAALEALPKTTPGPWNRGYGNFVYQGEKHGPEGTQKHIATLEVDQHTHEECEEAFANAVICAAAPLALAWIAKAKPVVEARRLVLKTLMELHKRDGANTGYPDAIQKKLDAIYEGYVTELAALNELLKEVGK